MRPWSNQPRYRAEKSALLQKIASGQVAEQKAQPAPTAAGKPFAKQVPKAGTKKPAQRRAE
jgi:hypothetical protein